MNVSAALYTTCYLGRSDPWDKQTGVEEGSATRQQQPTTAQWL
jgi:hypothetical protein